MKQYSISRPNHYILPEVAPENQLSKAIGKVWQLSVASLIVKMKVGDIQHIGPYEIERIEDEMRIELNKRYRTAGGGTVIINECLAGADGERFGGLYFPKDSTYGWREAESWLSNGYHYNKGNQPGMNIAGEQPLDPVQSTKPTIRYDKKYMTTNGHEVELFPQLEIPENTFPIIGLVKPHNGRQFSRQWDNYGRCSSGEAAHQLIERATARPSPIYVLTNHAGKVFGQTPERDVADYLLKDHNGSATMRIVDLDKAKVVATK